MERSVSRQKDRFQLGYLLPSQAYSSCVYPRQPANGSSVIIYGHDDGLRLVWYAGKPFKPAKKAPPPPKVNGSSSKANAAVIDLDDDDDEPQAKAPGPNPVAEFQDEDDEVDPSAPYGDVRRYVDIPLGSAALHVAIPSTLREAAHSPPDTFPALYLDTIVVAVACADLSIRLVTFPLAPPAPEAHDVATMGLQTTKIYGPNSHQDFVSDLAVTYSLNPEPADEDTPAQPSSRSQSKEKPSESQRWSLLVASVSSTGTGLLLVHQLPLQGNRVAAKPEHLVPIRRQALRCPTMGARLSFNTSPYPADRHSSLLLTLPAQPSAKLYQVFPHHLRERRGSTATADSSSTTRSARLASGDGGKFLVTLLPPFLQESSGPVPRRKRVLDSQWIAGGKAIIALLEDGEWGIWDLEAVGPSTTTTSQNLVRGQGNVSGIQGGSITHFAVRSSLVPASQAKKNTAAPAQPMSGSLAPMTPSTRKTRSENLFQGSLASPSPPPTKAQLGAIHIADQTPHKANDEAVVLSYGSENTYIPSIMSFWKSESVSRGTFSSTASRPVRLPSLRLGGQLQTHLALIPRSSDAPPAAAGLFGTETGIPDFVITTPTRLVLDLAPLQEAPADPEPRSSTSLLPAKADQALLKSGDLDVDGMDRILAEMAPRGQSARPGPENTFNPSMRKSVGFRMDDDGDVDMGSPTPAKFATVRGPRRNVPGTPRRVFT